VARRLLHRLPREVLRSVRLLVRPETVLRWHRDLIARRHARISRPIRVGRPRTIWWIRHWSCAWAREQRLGISQNPRRLPVVGIKVAASTVWEILQDAGIDPAQGTSTEVMAGAVR
jgi:putative transposase